jgi:thiamine biosynthesis protein ThiC
MSIHQLHPQGHPLTWQERLDTATTEFDVVNVARDYVATLSHDELMQMPEGLRPGKIVDANDITTYAFELVRHECHDEGAQRLVQRLAHVLSRASIRLSEIMVTDRKHPGEGAHSGDSEQRSA